MKKKLVLLITIGLIASLTACGAQNENHDNSDDDDIETSEEQTDDLLDYDTEDGYATFSINVNEKIDVDSWLGICEEGKYLYESDADEYDLCYTYPEDFYDEDGNINPSPYTYILGYDYLEDGDYTLVLTDTDCDGYVIFYAPCTIKGGELKVKTSKLVHNAMPEEFGTVVDDYYIEDDDYPDDYTDLYPDDNAGGSSTGNLPSGNNDSGNNDDLLVDPYDDYDRDPLEFAELCEDKLSVKEVIGVSVPNDTLVLKYNGVINVCGESSIYYVLGGFYEDGSVNWLTGTSRLWYFFDDDTTYRMAFEAAKANDNLIIKDYNPVSHYFSVITFFRNSWEYYDDIVDEVNSGILPVEMPPTPDYVVVE